MKKTGFGIASIVLALAIPIAGATTALHKKSMIVNCDNPEFAEYVSAYTDGVISKNSSVKIRLAEDFANLISDENLNNELFEFSPNIDGKCIKLDDRTLEFVPNESMHSGTDYLGMLKLDKISNVKENLRNFIFSFSTVPQNLKVSIDEQITTDRNSLKTLAINGTVKTADFENPDNIKKCISAFIDNKELNINWITNREGKAFIFSIDNIERKEYEQKLVIKYNGNNIDSDCKGETSTEIPALNQFKVTKINVVKNPNQCVEINFSDPLKESQNLNGLVSVFDENGIVDCKTECEGNKIKLFTNKNVSGLGQITISAGISNIVNNKLDKEKTYKIQFSQPNPEIRTVKNGIILPDGDNGLVYPFEAINLKAVDVTIIKIFEHNILGFTKYGSMSNTDNYNLKNVGVPIFKKTIHLNNDNDPDIATWKRYSLDISKLIEPERGAIYNIKINFRKSHTAFNCDSCNGGDPCDDEKDFSLKDVKWNPGEYESEWEYSYSGEGNSWEHEDDPCYKAYYTPNRAISQNILASNLGMICKKDLKNNITIYVTDLKTAKPISGAKVDLYGYQEQLLVTKSTNKNGQINFGEYKNAYYAVAKRGNERAYITITDGNSLSLSHFNVSGNQIQEGLKGYIYGERGVWRPGDTVHLTFVLKEDPLFALPDGHPITFEVTNPLSQIIEKKTFSKNSNNFYVLNFATSSDAVTGVYNAAVKCGSAYFYKNVRIETVKPNRLKIDVKFDDDILTSTNNHCTISSRWLHGASAKGLKVEMECSAKYSPLKFDKWQNYSFDNNNTELDGESISVFEGNLNNDGKVSFNPEFDFNQDLPSQVKATFTTRVFEQSGNFSTDQMSINYLPYDSYTGISLKNEKDYTLETDIDQPIDVVVVDNKGNLINKPHKLEMKFYKLRWSWWWEEGNYQSENDANLLKTETQQVTGKGTFSIRVNYPEWGRYMVKISDLTTGTSSSKEFYLDWPESRGRNTIQGQGATTVLLTTDKPKYNTGETVKLTIPTPENGRALVSIENGTKTIKSEWINTQKGSTEYSFVAENSMEPGVYAFVTILQPHSQTVNDMPIRMYGVLPIDIENPETILHPVISMNDNLEAESEVKITVSEQNNKSMTYTLAVVDDGLLDLTRFKTPDLWKEFYSREALGVKTWDVYDNVIGAYGGRIEKMFSVGGDESANVSNPKKANNLEPVAIFLGPFTINGQQKTHTVKLPKYFGSVRTMVVAGNGKAFGKAEKTCTVTKPLMVFATAPRVLGPNEKFKLPISVFTGENSIKNVTVSVKTINGLKSYSNSQNLTFTEKGEQMPTFDLETLSDEGLATFEISAVSGSYKSTMKLAIEIREPNAPESKTYSKAVNPGESAEIVFTPLGKQGKNKGVINISSIIPLNFEGRLQYLLTYPHGCLEQTISKAFPQLFVCELTNSSAEDKEKAENNVKLAIEKIYKQQLAGGGLCYWPGENYPDLWVTTYAGHFMIEAQKKGFSISSDFMNKWKNFEKQNAENWFGNTSDSYLIQAYRLYVLAIAGEPLTGAMNRLKEDPKLPNNAKYHLASAYTVAGKVDIAKQILNKNFSGINRFSNTITFYSDIKGKAITLQTYCELGDKEKAFTYAKLIADRINSEYWMSTQTTAFSLIALSQYFSKFKPTSNIDCNYVFNSKNTNVKSDKAFYTNKLEINNTQPQTISFKNNSNGIIFVEVTNTGVPPNGKEKADSSNLAATVKYMLGDQEIDPSNINQGTDFDAIVTIKNTSSYTIEDLALSEIFPSGWEILDNNYSFSDNNNDNDYYYSNNGSVRYTDLRDDRIYTYFSLSAGASITCKTRLNATYLGQFYLPGILCESQYNHSYFIKTKGKYVNINKL
ncbi:MAG: MG2 domain-containing protein [Bacteroidales bacterium]|nr:MG2 domain-containing protein [Bacteroidales bacterium]